MAEVSPRLCGTVLLAAANSPLLPRHPAKVSPQDPVPSTPHAAVLTPLWLPMPLGSGTALLLRWGGEPTTVPGARARHGDFTNPGEQPHPTSAGRPARRHGRKRVPWPLPREGCGTPCLPLLQQLIVLQQLHDPQLRDGDPRQVLQGVVSSNGKWDSKCP